MAKKSNNITEVLEQLCGGRLWISEARDQIVRLLEANLPSLPAKKLEAIRKNWSDL